MRRFRWIAVVVLVVAPFVVGVGTAAADDPLPKIVPGNASAVEGDAGTTTIEIPVTLSMSSADTVSAVWTTTFGPGVEPPASATPAEDFVAASGTVEFLPGDTIETVSITVNGDTIVEPDEYIVLAFGNPTNAVMGGFWGLGFGIINDDDAIPVLVPGQATVAERDTGTTVVAVPVRLSQPVFTTVTADWVTLSGPGVEPPAAATPGDDFVDTPGGTVTFAPGDTSETVSITIVGDTIVEPDEYIVLAFGKPTNAVIGGYFGLGFGIIANDDGAPVRSLSLDPPTGFDGGDTVTVTGAGWTPNATVALCQAANDPSISPPQDACLTDNVPLLQFSADGSGEFSVQVELRRWGLVPGLAAWIDCTRPSPGCVIGAAEPADLGTVTATPLVFATPPAPPATRGELTVTPDVNLVVGQTVTMAGSGFRPNELIDLHQCETEPVFNGPTACDWGNRVQTTTDGTGAFSASFEVAGTSALADCTVDTCVLAAAEAVDFVGTYVIEPISFALPALPILEPAWTAEVTAGTSGTFASWGGSPFVEGRAVSRNW